MVNLEGAVLSDYLLLECISRGNVADVYRAQQNDGGHYEVAVKIFRPGYAEREPFRAYFMYEAEKIGRFDHAHILPFIEYGEGENLLYSVTPFVKSGTLEDLLRKVGGKFSAMQAQPIVQQLCSAVQYAHEHDVIHGNIKPSNVFVANDGRVLLADFGIVRAYADGQQSMARLEWGTTEYAAPEQSLGLLRASSDIYTLGTVFFRLLTGAPLFKGQTPVEILLKHVREEPPSARTLNPNISEAVDDVLHKALRKRSDDRYATAAELGQAFAAAVAWAPVSSQVARPVSPPTHPQVSPVPASAPLQVSHTAVISLPPGFLQTTAQAPVLPEQHAGIASATPPRSTARIHTPPTVPPDMGPQQSWPLEPIEWSPLAQSATNGVHSQTFDYLHNKPQIAHVRAESAHVSADAPGFSQKKEEHQKHKLLLPILIVILLLLGLLGALLSSFLLPTSPGSSGMHSSTVYLAYRAGFGTL